MKAVRVNEIDNFDKQVQEAVNESSSVYVVFFGTETPETSESWCPDCVIADPLIRKAILTHAPSDAVLLEAPVGLRGDWKGNTSHPYRTRKDFDLPAIPTLYKWSKEGPGARLVEAECADAALLESFIKA